MMPVVMRYFAWAFGVWAIGPLLLGCSDSPSPGKDSGGAGGSGDGGSRSEVTGGGGTGGASQPAFGGSPSSGGTGGFSGTGGSQALRTGTPGAGVLANTSCGDDPCDENATCVSVGLDARCECNLGFSGDGVSCENVDECVEAFDGCHADATCADTVGSYECSCDVGVGDGFFCGADPCAGKCGTGTCTATMDGYACDCPLGTGGVNCEVDCSGELAFPPALEAAIRYEISKPDGAIYATDLADDNWLWDLEGDIDDLSGLECWPTLETLDLGKMGDAPVTLVDITPLAGLSRLTAVDLSCSEVTDLSPLSNKPALESLILENYSDCLSTVPLTDLSPLVGATQLTRLWLGGRPLGSLEPVGSLSRLEDLVVVNGGVSDISGLSSLSAVRRIVLYGNDIGDLSGLSPLPELYELWLSSNQVTGLASLAGHPKLRYLKLSSNGISDVSGLSSLVNVLELDLGFNDVVDVSPLSGMARLARLSLTENQVTDVSSLLDEPTFGFGGTLSLRDNPLDCDTQPEVIAELQARGMTVGVRDDYCP